MFFLLAYFTLYNRYSAFSKTSLIIWKFTGHILLKSGLENFEHYFAGVWDECNHVVLWTFFGRFFTTVLLGKPAMHLPCVLKVFKSALEHLYIDLVPVVFSEKVNTVGTFIYMKALLWIYKQKSTYLLIQWDTSSTLLLTMFFSFNTESFLFVCYSCDVPLYKCTTHLFKHTSTYGQASLVAQIVKSPPAM